MKGLYIFLQETRDGAKSAVPDSRLTLLHLAFGTWRIIQQQDTDAKASESCEAPRSMCSSAYLGRHWKATEASSR